MNGAVKGFAPAVPLWDPWTLNQVAKVLAEVDVPWYVAGGWAIDLFLGGQRREHEDLEIAVPNERFAEVADALTAFEICVITGPREATPLEQAAGALETTHQTWVRDRETDVWRLDVFREPSEGDMWICRRDLRIRLPYHSVIGRTEDGIPYGRPEIIVLYKAKHAHQAERPGRLRGRTPAARTRATSLARRRARPRPSRAPVDRRARGARVTASAAAVSTRPVRPPPRQFRLFGEKVLPYFRS